MALKALLLKREIDNKRSALEKLDRKEEFEKRTAELEAAINEMPEDCTPEDRDAVAEEVEKLEAEQKENEAASEELREQIQNLEKELDAEEKEQEVPEDTTPDERSDKMEKILTRDSAEYVNAYAEYIKSAGKNDQVRTLVTELADAEVIGENGALPVPTIVADTIRTAWEADRLLDLVDKTYVRGVLKQAFEVSATDAEYHEEGKDAPQEETLVLGVATISPKMIKKWISVSDEALTMGGEAFLRYIYEELAHKIVEFASKQLIEAVDATPAASTTEAPGQSALAVSEIKIGTIAEALGNLSGRAQNPVVVMNRLTWAAFKAVQYAASYPVDPFEGLEVVFSNALPAFSAAESNKTFAIVGDFGYGARANFPRGFDVEVLRDPYSKAPEDLERIVGKMYVGLGIVAPNAFCKLQKAAAINPNTRSKATEDKEGA